MYSGPVLLDHPVHIHHGIAALRIHAVHFSPPESCAKFVAEVVQKIGKVAPKLRAIWLIFGSKMLLWSFGTVANFGNEQKTTRINII